MFLFNPLILVYSAAAEASIEQKPTLPPSLQAPTTIIITSATIIIIVIIIIIIIIIISMTIDRGI